ncbi:MAG: PIN domain-containing protein [Deltaproteobacteria bacterium]|nr:PIN domain-containing protein [Deltaproteobacteria bacterium]
MAVDTAPLIYFLVDAAGRASIAEKLLQLGASGTLQLVVSVLTEAELLVAPLRAQDATSTQTVRALIDGPAGFKVIAVEREIAYRAAELRARHGFKLPDAITAASAIESGCTILVGNDRVFKRLDSSIVYLHLDEFI